MIQINLLPSGEKRRPARRAGTRGSGLTLPTFSGDPYMAGIVVLALLVVLGFAFAYWRVDTGMAEAEMELERQSADSTRFASTIQLVETLRARQDTIEGKIEVIRDVDARRFVWPHVLDEISRALPAYTWLSSISAVEQAAPMDSTAAPITGPSFNLEGNAGSTQALTLFMKSLESSPFIRDVSLVTSERATTSGRSYQKFTLEARYETPDSSFIETIPIITVQ